jgi:signal transduction histidine kinase/CheY-like chemotaxis protein
MHQHVEQEAPGREVCNVDIAPLSLSNELPDAGSSSASIGIPAVVGHDHSKTPAISSEVRKAFAQSAVLIRESLEMDGMVFLDTSTLSSRSRISYHDHSQSAQSVDENEPNGTTSTQPCAVLASSIAGESSPVSFTIPQDLLDRLANRFPRGRIFSADHYGVLSGHSTPTSQSSLLDNSFSAAITEDNKRADVDELLAHLPGATSAILLPMWHFQKERWFAAGIGWTCDSTHFFDSCDTTYLSAFSNAIMVEILRYEALAVSNAKSDFISSISHEIRSPLHGILATTELLSDSIRSSDERSMLAMIQSCGTTLLDTMNHLLEFAKINKLSQSTSKKSQGGNRILDTVDLSSLVEGVTENVSAGYAFETNLHRQCIPGQNISSTPAEESNGALHVLFTVDIQPFGNWEMPLEAGAWKRIVMNLVGNALKYTPSGHITAKLEVQNGEICFSVKDTGIGIGDEYLKYRLFTPFAQENTFSSGTGLGLAIVQQIVSNLGGRLEVQSEVGVGTLVSVLVPLPPTILLKPVITNQRFTNLAGRRLCFLKPTILKQYASSHDCLAYTQRLESSVSDIATRWLGMETTHSTSADGAYADVYVVDGSFEVAPDTVIPTALYGKPIVVITGSRPHNHSSCPTLKFLQTPFGPRRLATVITGAIESAVLAQITPRVMTNGHMTYDEPLASVSNGVLKEEIPAQRPPPLTTVDGPDASIPRQSELTAPLRAQVPSAHHILVVDDNAINLKILTKLLDGLGCSYTTAVNGEEAVQSYKSKSSAPTNSPFTLIFMDISMPVMNGFDATREIRHFEKENGIAPVKVVALTGLGDESSESQAFTCGMDEFWTKPIKLDRVKELLTEGDGKT